MKIAFNSVILCWIFLSVTFIAYGPEVGVNKPWGQTYDSARKHYCRFLNISFKCGSNFTLVSHEKPILQFVHKARDRVLGTCVTKHL